MTESQTQIEPRKEAPQAYETPAPHPSLKRLDIMVGTWNLKGRTLDAKADNISGQTTFEWLPGGFFLVQRFKFNFAGLKIQALELIRYDPSSDIFPSTVYSNLAGLALPYEYDVRGNVVKIHDPTNGANFKGTRSEDGNTFSGGWRPEPGREGPGNIPYDLVGTRAKQVSTSLFENV